MIRPRATLMFVIYLPSSFQFRQSWVQNLALIYPPKKRSRTPTSEADTEVVDCHPSTVDNLATQDMKATPPPKPVENPSEVSLLHFN